MSNTEQYAEIAKQINAILENFSKWNCPHPGFLKSLLAEKPNATDREVIAQLHAAMTQPTDKEKCAAIYQVLLTLQNPNTMSKTMFNILRDHGMATGTAAHPKFQLQIFPQESQKDLSPQFTTARA